MVEIVEKTQAETAQILSYSKTTDAVVENATGNFNTMITNFETANDQLVRIAAAIEALSTSNSDITEKVFNINDLSQNIAKDMTTSEQSVGTLNLETEKMLEMVSAFKTGEGVFEEQMIPVFDSCRERIENSIYVLAIDKKGYLAAHHAAFSQPMTNDPEHNLLHSRHQRIFMGNETEKRRCSHTKPMLMQTYMRDTGQILNDLSMPIYIDGQHWGAFIIGFDPKVMFATHHGSSA